MAKVTGISANKAEPTKKVEKVKDPKKEAKKAARKVAKETIRAFMVANPTSEIFKPLLLVVGTGTRGGGGGGSQIKILGVMQDLFSKEKSIAENRIWDEFKLGRAEMRKICVNMIKRVEDPLKRIWVKFNPEAETYTVEGKGANAPKGWTGYTPVVIEDLEIT